MPKRNYQFEKRQKDLAKKQKREEKRMKRLERTREPGAPDDGTAPAGGDPPASE